MMISLDSSDIMDAKETSKIWKTVDCNYSRNGSNHW